MTHLWEIEHPFTGPPAAPVVACVSLDALIAAVEPLDPELNLVWRFDWYDWSASVHDARFNAGDDRSGQTLRLYVIRPTNPDTMVVAYECPISHDQEPDVLDWLRGPRVLGPIVDLWEPLLGAYAYDDD